MRCRHGHGHGHWYGMALLGGSVEQRDQPSFSSSGVLSGFILDSAILDRKVGDVLRVAWHFRQG